METIVHVPFLQIIVSAWGTIVDVMVVIIVPVEDQRVLIRILHLCVFDLILGYIVRENTSNDISYL